MVNLIIKCNELAKEINDLLIACKEDKQNEKRFKKIALSKFLEYTRLRYYIMNNYNKYNS